MITEAENRFYNRLYDMYGEDQANFFFKQKVNKQPPKVEREDTSGYINLNKL